jgi:hypothetical protein
MQTEQPLPVLKCKNIVASPRGLAEADGRKAVMFVPTAEIDHVILKYGKAEHRPLVSLSIGIVLGLLGIAGLIELILAPRGLRYELGMIFFGLIGGSIIFDGLKERHFLEVHKTKGSSRLVFSKGTPLNDIRDFCEKVRTTYRYKITEDV